MEQVARGLPTRRGKIAFPAYVPILDLGHSSPLERALRFYLPRLAYALQLGGADASTSELPAGVPILLAADWSGDPSARLAARDDLAVVEQKAESGTLQTHPGDVLDRQERRADVAFTMQLPPPTASDGPARDRYVDLTVATAHWALANRRRRDLPLFAILPSMEEGRAREVAHAYREAGFDGISLVAFRPEDGAQARLRLVEAVRSAVAALPLHVDNPGDPSIIRACFQSGADLVASRAHLRLAEEGRLWEHPDAQLLNPTFSQLVELAICNLAAATRRPVPLAVSPLVFRTYGRFNRTPHSTDPTSAT